MNEYIIDIRKNIKYSCNRKKSLCKALKLYLRNTKHEYRFKYDINIFRIKNSLSEMHITIPNLFNSFIDSKSLLLRYPFECAIYYEETKSFFYIENNTLYYQDMVKKENILLLTLPDNIEDTQSDLLYKTINDFLSKETV